MDTSFPKVSLLFSGFKGSRFSLISGTGYTVHPNASLAHNVPDHVPGEVPEVFDGRRWLDKGKPASMAGPGHLAFGLGRWACPGRVFAIAGKSAIQLLETFD